MWVLELQQHARNPVSRFLYAWAVRRGRKAGKRPPAEQLRLWVQRVLGVPTELSPRVAYAIARHIGLKGTKPNDYFFRTLRENQGLIHEAVTTLGREVVQDINGRIKTLQGMERHGDFGLFGL